MPVDVPEVSPVDALAPSPAEIATPMPNPPRTSRTTDVTLAILLGAIGGGFVACVAQRHGAPPLRASGTALALPIDDFESWREGAAPTHPWQHETFAGVQSTLYRVRRDASGGYLSGIARSGGSLLTRSLDVDPNEFRYLRFRWRVTTLPVGADIRRRDADDCGMRVCVTFAYQSERAPLGEKIARNLVGRELPGSSLCYVWTDGVETGRILPNPYTDHTRVLVLRSEPADLGRWTTVERDLLGDYARAFERPPPRITGVAIMVDADQTRSRAAADIDDLELHRSRR